MRRKSCVSCVTTSSTPASPYLPARRPVRAAPRPPGAAGSDGARSGPARPGWPRRDPRPAARIKRADRDAHRAHGRSRQAGRVSSSAPTITSPSRSARASSSRGFAPFCAVRKRPLRRQAAVTVGELSIDRAAHARRSRRPACRADSHRICAPAGDGAPARPRLHPCTVARRAARQAFEAYERAIDAHVKNIRRKIETDPARAAPPGDGIRRWLPRSPRRPSDRGSPGHTDSPPAPPPALVAGGRAVAAAARRAPLLGLPSPATAARGSSRLAALCLPASVRLPAHHPLVFAVGVLTIGSWASAHSSGSSLRTRCCAWRVWWSWRCWSWGRSDRGVPSAG